MYSTIQKKKCKGNCGKYPTLGYNGFCYSCAPNEIKEKVISQKKETAKKRNQRIASKLKALPENIEMLQYKKELDEWFAYHTINSLRECENCSADLTSYSDTDWKACQHHLIDKSKINGCPSVATVLENHGVLCKWGKGDAGGCHSLWHSSYETASKMPFFKIAKERFDKFQHLIAPDERRKIPKIFL